MKRSILTLLAVFFFQYAFLLSQSKELWHDRQRELRYTPQGDDFVIVNGAIKFNRALYGTNTAFRIETGDVPEFSLFMPNRGGNLQFGILREKGSIWLNDAKYIKSIYRAGARIYEIKDPFAGKGTIEISVLAMSDSEGLIAKCKVENMPEDASLLCMFGGASNKRFSRNGDLGVDDPLGFAINEEGCLNNDFSIEGNSFRLRYAQGSKVARNTVGVFPENAILKTGSPYEIVSPYNVWHSTAKDNKPVLLTRIPLITSGIYYFGLKNDDGNYLTYNNLKDCYDKAEQRRQEISGAIKIETPDPYINPLGGVLSTAADGIWENSWLHGAIGWRMPLNGWRAAYTGDVIGWHDRARQHFNGYAASQIKNIEPVISHPSQDTALHYARAEKVWGTQMYSKGYICRNPYDTTKMHHYDMNLCYIDELLWHLNWTGDIAYAKQMWPVLKSHLAWEKRNFDPDNDGLYDAYACIWASDALYYNSGGVTHSSAYNYRANKMAALIAGKIGIDPEPYRNEADKILKAINSTLWLSDKGWWTEYKDFMGNKTVHQSAAVWTVYHAIDSDIATPFQAYQAIEYVNTQIPRIPVKAEGLKENGYYTISTSNWLPYSWSINNVAFAEVAHTSLAYWQAGRNDEAFKLFKSSILDGMYLGSSPGNIGQISFYDAARGECYRDFGDPVGVYSRALIQGLFGVLPEMMNNRLILRPGFPKDWNKASLSTSDIDFAFKRDKNLDIYTVKQRFNKPVTVELFVKATKERIKNVIVNGKKNSWSLVDAVEFPLIRIVCNPTENFEISIEWQGSDLQKTTYPTKGVCGQHWRVQSSNEIIKTFDPQGILKESKIESNSLQGTLSGSLGHRTLFIQLKQGQMVWWEPVQIEIKELFSLIYNPESEKLQFSVKNNTDKALSLELQVNPGNNFFQKTLDLKPDGLSELIDVPSEKSVFGTNRVCILEKGKAVYESQLVNWNIKNTDAKYEAIDIDSYFNARVTDIFNQKYLSPRSPYTTLQIPAQGIGEWCHPLLNVAINDSGLRKAARDNIFYTPMGIPFRTMNESGERNILFTSLWNNYPREFIIPLSGKASHAYLMMAGSTNHMQCHIVNGTIEIHYADNTREVLELINPDNWVPIEQDLFFDGFAFRSEHPRPWRFALKTGVISRDIGSVMNIKPTEVYGRNIEGGAGVILDLPLNTGKELKSIAVRTIANDVVIGLMGVTLLRNF